MFLIFRIIFGRTCYGTTVVALHHVPPQKHAISCVSEGVTLCNCPNSLKRSLPMIGENRQLVTNEPVEFEK
jgi:hypothetical protein